MAFGDNNLIINVNDIINSSSMDIYDLPDDVLLANLNHYSDELRTLLHSSPSIDYEEFESFIDDITSVVDMLGAEAEARSLV